MPKLDEGSLLIETRRLPSTSLPQGMAIAWKEFDGEKTTVNLMTSHDDGMTWSTPTTIAKTTDTSDHPLLVSDGRRVFLSWMTKADGYRFQPIEDEP